MNHAQILPYEGKTPIIDPSAWISPTSVIIGDTVIGADCSVWFNTVIRGDVNTIRIGRGVNIQDGVICHVTIAKAPLVIEDYVSIAHGAIIHGCTLKRGCLIGIGAKVLDLAIIGEESLIAAGSVVREGQVIPSGELWAGIPAVKKRDLASEERKSLLDTAERYVLYRLKYMGSDIEIPQDLLPRSAPELPINAAKT
ncbi:gamma carbonic anhydrase family protein [bacterium]|nr:gamma carbonic anhydrase family protein [bacterium]